MSVMNEILLARTEMIKNGIKPELIKISREKYRELESEIDSLNMNTFKPEKPGNLTATYFWGMKIEIA